MRIPPQIVGLPVEKREVNGAVVRVYPVIVLTTAPLVYVDERAARYSYRLDIVATVATRNRTDEIRFSTDSHSLNWWVSLLAESYGQHNLYNIVRSYLEQLTRFFLTTTDELVKRHAEKLRGCPEMNELLSEATYESL